MTLKDSSIHFFLFRPMTIKFNHSVLHETLPMVSALNNENWSQMNPTYHEDDFMSCCLGAHLAYYFKKHNYDHEGYVYSDGTTEFYIRLGINADIASSLLFLCGSPKRPFGAVPYICYPKDIWKRMMMIEGVINISKLRKIIETLYKPSGDNNIIYTSRKDNPYYLYSGHTYNKEPNIIVDKPELFDGIIEFNHLHPKFKDLPSQSSDLPLEFKEVKLKDKELALV